MPFASKSQMRACFAADDPNWDCDEWLQATKKPSALPQRKKPTEEKSAMTPLIASRTSADFRYRPEAVKAWLSSSPLLAVGRPTNSTPALPATAAGVEAASKQATGTVSLPHPTGPLVMPEQRVQLTALLKEKATEAPPPISPLVKKAINLQAILAAGKMLGGRIGAGVRRFGPGLAQPAIGAFQGYQLGEQAGGTTGGVLGALAGGASMLPGAGKRFGGTPLGRWGMQPVQRALNTGAVGSSADWALSNLGLTGPDSHVFGNLGAGVGLGSGLGQAYSAGKIIGSGASLPGRVGAQVSGHMPGPSGVDGFTNNFGRGYGHGLTSPFTGAWRWATEAGAPAVAAAGSQGGAYGLGKLLGLGTVGGATAGLGYDIAKNKFIGDFNNNAGQMVQGFQQHILPQWQQQAQNRFGDFMDDRLQRYGLTNEQGQVAPLHAVWNEIKSMFGGGGGPSAVASGQANPQLNQEQLQQMLAMLAMLRSAAAGQPG